VDARTGPGGEAAGSVFEEGISGREVSANPRSSPLPSPAVVLSPELELLASTLPALAGLALSKRSFSVCGAFGGHSWNASTRAAKTTVPKTPVASQTVSRLNLLIVSLFTGAICRIDTVDFLTEYPGFSTQVTPLKNESGSHAISRRPVDARVRLLAPTGLYWSALRCCSENQYWVPPSPRPVRAIAPDSLPWGEYHF